ncbi:hypothetical protein [Demequina activiva]|nr:hypothetical protein [Demequina activiva]
MSRLLSALAWSGRDTMLSLFVAFPRGGSSSLQPPESDSGPDALRFYELEDPENILPAFECVELDLIYNEPPLHLADVIAGWLQQALAAGAKLAWFAFEGSFDFEHVLTADIADQVYAVATRDGVELALADEQREGAAWPETLEAVRRRAGL